MPAPRVQYDNHEEIIQPWDWDDLPKSWVVITSDDAVGFVGHPGAIIHVGVLWLDRDDVDYWEELDW